eukprot:scaffold24_cov245-Pinguiococcus_pyrenoidosus.AAC.22
MVSFSVARTTASFVRCASGDSRVVAKRLPIATPSAPRLSAARRPWPLAKPPAATIGRFVLARRHGTRTRLVTSPPCAAASCPVTRRASAPISSADLACFSVVTVAKTFPPYVWALSAIHSACIA